MKYMISLTKNCLKGWSRGARLCKVVGKLILQCSMQIQVFANILQMYLYVEDILFDFQLHTMRTVFAVIHVCIMHGSQSSIRPWLYFFSFLLLIYLKIAYKTTETIRSISSQEAFYKSCQYDSILHLQIIVFTAEQFTQHGVYGQLCVYDNM